MEPHCSVVESTTFLCLYEKNTAVPVFVPLSRSRSSRVRTSITFPQFPCSYLYHVPAVPVFVPLSRSRSSCVRTSITFPQFPCSYFYHVPAVPAFVPLSRSRSSRVRTSITFPQFPCSYLYHVTNQNSFTCYKVIYIKLQKKTSLFPKKLIIKTHSVERSIIF